MGKSQFIFLNMLYESPGVNQTDGLPPAASLKILMKTDHFEGVWDLKFSICHADVLPAVVLSGDP